MDDIPCHIVDDLGPDATRDPPDHRLALPHRFGNGEAKSFFDGFLEHDGGRSLEGIDLNIRFWWELKDMYIGVVSSPFLNLTKEGLSFRIVRHPAPGQDESAIVMLFHKPVGHERAEGVFEPLKPRHLQENGFISWNAQPVQGLVDLSFG